MDKLTKSKVRIFGNYMLSQAFLDTDGRPCCWVAYERYILSRPSLSRETCVKRTCTWIVIFASLMHSPLTRQRNHKMINVRWFLIWFDNLFSIWGAQWFYFGTWCHKKLFIAFTEASKTAIFDKLRCFSNFDWQKITNFHQKLTNRNDFANHIFEILNSFKRYW